jgi:hypothetical protein
MEQKLKLEFSPQMMNVISEALMEMPFRIAAPVIAEIQRQLGENNAARVAEFNKTNGSKPAEDTVQ